MRSATDDHDPETTDVDQNIRRLNDELEDITALNANIQLENHKKDQRLEANEARLKKLKEIFASDAEQLEMDYEHFKNELGFQVKVLDERVSSLDFKKQRMTILESQNDELKQAIISAEHRLRTEGLQHAEDIHKLNKRMQTLRVEMENTLRTKLTNMDRSFQQKSYSALSDYKKQALLKNARLKDESTIQDSGLTNLEGRLTAQQTASTAVLLDLYQLGMQEEKAMEAIEGILSAKAATGNLMRSVQEKEIKLKKIQEKINIELSTHPLAENLQSSILECEDSLYKENHSIRMWEIRLAGLQSVEASLRPVAELEKVRHYSTVNFPLSPILEQVHSPSSAASISTPFYAAEDLGGVDTGGKVPLLGSRCVGSSRVGPTGTEGPMTNSSIDISVSEMPVGCAQTDVDELRGAAAGVVHGSEGSSDGAGDGAASFMCRNTGHSNSYGVDAGDHPSKHLDDDSDDDEGSDNDSNTHHINYIDSNCPIQDPSSARSDHVPSTVSLRQVEALLRQDRSLRSALLPLKGRETMLLNKPKKIPREQSSEEFQEPSEYSQNMVTWGVLEILKIWRESEQDRAEFYPLRPLTVPSDNEAVLFSARTPVDSPPVPLFRFRGPIDYLEETSECAADDQDTPVLQIPPLSPSQSSSSCPSPVDRYAERGRSSGASTARTTGLVRTEDPAGAVVAVSPLRTSLPDDDDVWALFDQEEGLSADVSLLLQQLHSHDTRTHTHLEPSNPYKKTPIVGGGPRMGVSTLGADLRPFVRPQRCTGELKPPLKTSTARKPSHERILLGSRSASNTARDRYHRFPAPNLGDSLSRSAPCTPSGPSRPIPTGQRQLSAAPTGRDWDGGRRECRSRPLEALKGRGDPILVDAAAVRAQQIASSVSRPLVDAKPSVFRLPHTLRSEKPSSAPSSGYRKETEKSGSAKKIRSYLNDLSYAKNQCDSLHLYRTAV